MASQTDWKFGISWIFSCF